MKFYIGEKLFQQSYSRIQSSSQTKEAPVLIGCEKFASEKATGRLKKIVLHMQIFFAHIIIVF